MPIYSCLNPNAPEFVPAVERLANDPSHSYNFSEHYHRSYTSSHLCTNKEEKPLYHSLSKVKLNPKAPEFVPGAKQLADSSHVGAQEVCTKPRLVEMNPKELVDLDNQALSYRDIITQDFATQDPVRFNGGGIFERTSIQSLIDAAERYGESVVVDPLTNLKIPIEDAKERIEELSHKEVIHIRHLVASYESREMHRVAYKREQQKTALENAVQSASHLNQVERPLSQRYWDRLEQEQDCDGYVDDTQSTPFWYEYENEDDQEWARQQEEQASIRQTPMPTDANLAVAIFEASRQFSVFTVEERYLTPSDEDPLLGTMQLIEQALDFFFYPRPLSLTYHLREEQEEQRRVRVSAQQHEALRQHRVQHLSNRRNERRALRRRSYRR
jgi:hypothetical protein